MIKDDLSEHEGDRHRNLRACLVFGILLLGRVFTSAFPPTSLTEGGEGHGYFADCFVQRRDRILWSAEGVP